MRVWSQSTFCSPNGRHLWLFLAACYLSTKGQGCGIIFVALLELNSGKFAQICFVWYLFCSSIKPDDLPSVSTAFHFWDTSFTFEKGLFTGIVAFFLEWLPHFLQITFNVSHLSITLLGLVLSSYSIENDGKAIESEVILHTNSAFKAKYVLLTKALLTGWLFAISWSVKRPSFFPRWSRRKCERKALGSRCVTR